MMTTQVRSRKAIVSGRDLRRPEAFEYLRWTLGLLLATAAVLKAIQFVQAPPFERLGPAFLVLGPAWMALWLASGVFRRWLWTCALVLFSGLGAVAGHTAFRGEASCGCFGALQISPWVTLGLDGIAIMALLLTRPKGNTSADGQGRRAILTAGVGVLLTVPLAVFMLRQPPVGLSAAGQAAASNQPDTPPGPNQLLADLGYVPAKSTHPIHFILANGAARPMAIVKIEKECNCVQFPTTLPAVPPHGTLPVEATFAAPDLHAPYTKHVVLFTDNPQMPTIVLQVQARIGLPFHSVPETLDLGVVAPGAPVDVPITLVNEGDQAVQLLFSISSLPEATVATPRVRLAQGDKVQLRLQGRVPTAASAAPQHFTVRFQTDSPEQTVVEIPGQYMLRSVKP